MASTAAEYQTLVDLADNAIESILTGGESVSFDGVNYTKANLGDLMRLRSFYEKKVARLSQGTRRVAYF